MKGSHALAMPLSKFYGKWAFADSKGVSSLQQNLPQFSDYLIDLKSKNELLFESDLERFDSELKQGLYFDSNIPTGYGVGSSGALCAAFFDVFCEDIGYDLPNLKKIFGQMESFFHGSSSGTDPLICYLNQPILIRSKEEMVVTRLPKENLAEKGHIFLLDTKITRQTGPFVQIFLKKCEQENYNKKCESLFAPQINVAINYFLEANWENLWESFHKIGVFQLEYFEEMIPDVFKKFWESSLEGDLFKLKLCGAGGGGFILGMTKDWEKTQKKLKTHQLISVFQF